MNRKLVAISALSLSVLPATAMAQAHRQLSQSDAAGSSANAIAASDIVVTAMRRPERARDVPASVTALNSEALASTGTTTLDQVAQRVPSLFITKLGDSRPRLYIRGVGTREYDPGSESSVGVFIDDMYVGRLSGVLSSLHDIDRIEVLKGPQTTLYGRNTIGGTINVVTKAPTDELSAEARAGFGNFGSHEVFAAISGPLSGDAVTGRIMAYESHSDGYMTNLTTGHHSQGFGDWGTRGHLVFKPSSALRISVIGDYFRGDGPSADAKNHGSPTDPGGTFFSGSTIGSPGAARPISVADRFADFYNLDSKLDRRLGSLIGKIEYQTSLGTIASISTYLSSRVSERRDFDATSLDAVTMSVAERSHQFSQELRFTSDATGALSLGGRVHWIAGLYYYHDNTARSDRFDFGTASVSAIRTGSPQNDVFSGNFTTRSWAVYAEATLDLTPRFSVTAGLRHTEDRKGLVQNDVASRPGAGFIAADFTTPTVRRDDGAWTPKVTASFKVSKDILAYATYTRGYKGGGFQYIPTTIAAALTTFLPETSNAYEIGSKMEFWSHRASLNISAFYYDDHNLQVQRSTTLVGGTIAIVTNNAEKSTIKGVDIEASLRPINGLLLQAAYSFVDAKYDRYFNNPPGQPLTPATDFSNTPIMRSPRHSIATSADYDIRLGGGHTLTPRIAWTYRSTFYFEPGGGDPKYGAAIPMTTQKGYSLVDVSLAYALRGFVLRAFADNVFNHYYLVDVQKLPFNYIVDYPGQPRTYGLSASYKF